MFIRIIDFSMAMACQICTRTYNSEFFDSIVADSSDVAFRSWASVARCLCYSWATCTILSSMQHVRGLQALCCSINLTWLDLKNTAHAHDQNVLDKT